MLIACLDRTLLLKSKYMIPTYIARQVTCIAASAFLASAGLSAFAQQLQKPEVIALTAGMNVIRAEVASAPSQRAQGLMHRQSMGANDGMIFVFEQPAEVCMWMKNTPLPLSVAFIDDEGKIVNIEEMQPLTLESHCSKKQARYALEMNGGWFQQKNVKPGVSIQGLSQITK